MLKIITDSCADLEESFVQEHNIGLANLHLQVDGANYTPGEDITTAQALAKIAQAQEMPKTSQPSPHAYQQLFAQTEPVGESLCLTVSSDLSGSFKSAIWPPKPAPHRCTRWTPVCAQSHRDFS